MFYMRLAREHSFPSLSRSQRNQREKWGASGLACHKNRWGVSGHCRRELPYIQHYQLGSAIALARCNLWGKASRAANDAPFLTARSACSIFAHNRALLRFSIDEPCAPALAQIEDMAQELIEIYNRQMKVAA